MDFKKLIPDFKSVSKTDWAKPHIDTKDKNWLILAGCALLMVIFAFLPWQTVAPVKIAGQSITVLGVTTWYGILGLLSALVAVYGILYKHIQFVFCGAALAAVLGLIGSFVVTGHTNHSGTAVPAEAIKLALAAGRCTISHVGAILFLLVSLALAAVSFLQIKKENE